MANTIQVKRSATPSAVPTTGQLALGEIAVNTYDGKVYIKKDNGTASIVEVGASGGGGLTSLNSQTGATQTFAVGTSGTNFAVSSSADTHTFNLPDASATARGVITTGTQTIAGQKNFTSSLGVNEASPGAQLQVTSSAAATKGLIVKTAASASANPMEMQDSAGTALMYVNTVGALVANGAYLGRGANNISTNLSVGAAVNFSVGGDQNVVVGIGAATNSFRNVIIGRGATANSQDNVVVGANGVVGTGGGNILIAAQSGDTRWSSNNCVVGSWSTCSASVGSVALFGYGSSASGSNAVAVGRSASAGADALALGRSASAAANCLDMRFGSGNPSRIAGDSNGQIGINEGTPGAQLQVTSGAAARKGLIVKAAASATANLVEVQNSSGTVLSSFNSSGQIGVGATATCSLDIYGTSANAQVNQFSADTTGATLTFQKSRGATVATNTIVQSGDQIGVITFNGANGSTYSNAAQIRAVIDTTPGASADMPGRIEFLTSSDGSATLTERMRIDNAGRIGIGRTPSGDSGLNINIGASFIVRSQSTGTANTTHYAFSNGNGDVGFINTSGAGTAFQTTSDYRLKENIVVLENALNRVSALKPCRFNFKTDSSVTIDGFIAHELQAVIPECVSGGKDEVKEDGSIKPQAVDYSRLTPLLTAAIQELSAKLDTLEQRLTLLETSS